MSEQTFRIHVVGPDLFCPDCGRWLVRIHEDGTHDLAGNSSVSLALNVSEPEWRDDGLVSYVDRASCLKRLCRLRRWLKGE
jgi:hypothetical protein